MVRVQWESTYFLATGYCNRISFTYKKLGYLLFPSCPIATLHTSPPCVSLGRLMSKDYYISEFVCPLASPWVQPTGPWQQIRGRDKHEVKHWISFFLSALPASVDQKLQLMVVFTCVNSRNVLFLVGNVTWMHHLFSARPGWIDTLREHRERNPMNL